MFQKNKRVLWLLNHKTLMPYEVQLLLNLGFEVFVPKVIPRTGTDFRSGVVDFAYDRSLTIPQRALKRLNNFNFYEESWSTAVVTIVNRYFGTVFTIPVFGKQFPEVLDKFEGQIVFRPFGIDNTRTYKQVLEVLYGFDSLMKIHALGDRFWFGEGYEQLHECEPPLLAKRALFLPIGVPESFFKNANQWNGSIKKILFICSISNPYYSAVYRQFKKQFGDLPHVIAGMRDVKVDDSSMLGHVSEEELHQLYRDCAVLYYHSTELRHVHYSPIEAAIMGMPIVFFRNSLLGRLCEASTPGCVDSLDEARTIVKRVIDGDRELIESLRKGQRHVWHKFSDAYCRPTWEKNLIESGFRARLQKEGPVRVWTREALRCVLAPIAGGLAFVPSRARLPVVPPDKLKIPQDDESVDGTIEQGIDFSLPAYPKFVLGTSGISENEYWGRWSVGKKVRIFFSQPLPKKFGLLITGGAYGPNVGKRFKVCIGSVSRFGTFRKGVNTAETLWLQFSMPKPASVIEIIIPHPAKPGADSRAIGLGFVRVQVVESLAFIPSHAQLAFVSAKRLSSPQEDESNGRTMEQGIDFTRPAYPKFVLGTNGLSHHESWGRWSDDKKVFVLLDQALPKKFNLLITGGGYGPNLGKRFKIRIGNIYRYATFRKGVNNPETLRLEFSLGQPSNVIEITVPRPTVPEGDPRSIGLGFVHLRILNDPPTIGATPCVR
jgi:hypothetical protein